MAVAYADIESAFRGPGLIVRGGFETAVDEDPASKTIVLIGNAGPDMWGKFAASIPTGRNPLDTWTKNLVSPRAEELGADTAFPNDRPYRPFQRWAMRTEPVIPSPLGILIHREFGLWHAYRAALMFDGPVPGIPAWSSITSPCESCTDKPCLTACPVGAFSTAGYDVLECVKYLARTESRPCHDGGCQARMACPVATEWQYDPNQRAFHAAAFFRSNR